MPKLTSIASSAVMALKMFMTLFSFYVGGVAAGGLHGSFSSNSPIRELARGAFLASWPVTNVPELEDIREESLMMSNKADAEDCGKRLLCEIARKEGKLEWDEKLLMEYYRANRIDYTSKSLFFNIAVKVGQEGQKCNEVYPRCILALPELLRILRRQGISFDIPGKDRDCQVYFLWKKKKPAPGENEVASDTNTAPDDQSSEEDTSSEDDEDDSKAEEEEEQQEQEEQDYST